MVVAGAVVVLGAHRMGAFTEPDPLFLFLMYLVHASPTAINIQVRARIYAVVVAWSFVASMNGLWSDAQGCTMTDIDTHFQTREMDQ